MSNERPDDARPGDASHWINKLGDPDPSATESWTGKNAAWEKLYSRLHEKPRRRIAFWYWAAAACLLLLLYIPVKQSIHGKGGMKMSGTTKPRGYAKDEGKGQEGVQPVVMSGGANMRRVIVHRMAYEGKKPDLKEDTKLAVPEPVSGSATTQETRYSPDDLVLPMAIIAPAKKKLRVVHINELDTAVDTGVPGRSNSAVSWAAIPYVQRPVRNVQIFTGNPGKRFFHFGRPKAQVEPSATAAADNIPPELIKIKLSPQN